ncbi:hypothetical protein GCM10010411_21960 [Actinomadura fulvescens]|uniref:Uncharacterized protein n=1 Tax=Actinomadura fulvescens TaxID=46160 RepID=A0ABN3PIZ4_9ACTN
MAWSKRRRDMTPSLESATDTKKTGDQDLRPPAQARDQGLPPPAQARDQGLRPPAQAGSRTGSGTAPTSARNC